MTTVWVNQPEPPTLTRQESCPDCGAWLNHWWSATPGDPGDVDPRADCTNPRCDWGY